LLPSAGGYLSGPYRLGESWILDWRRRVHHKIEAPRSGPPEELKQALKPPGERKLVLKLPGEEKLVLKVAWAPRSVARASSAGWKEEVPSVFRVAVLPIWELLAPEEVRPVPEKLRFLPEVGAFQASLTP
jgi:hypothetical protein